MAASRPASRDDLEAMASTIRQWVIEQALESRVGHIGSALSIVEILTVLWGGVMRDPGADDPERDRFVLAKGHAALALYASLRWLGLLDEHVYRTYCRDGSPLGVHPERGQVSRQRDRRQVRVDLERRGLNLPHELMPARADRFGAAIDGGGAQSCAPDPDDRRAGRRRAL